MKSGGYMDQFCKDILGENKLNVRVLFFRKRYELKSVVFSTITASTYKN